MFIAKMQREIWKKTGISCMYTMPLGQGDWAAWAESFGKQMRRKKASASPKGESAPFHEAPEADESDVTAPSEEEAPSKEAVEEAERTEDVKLCVKGGLEEQPDGTGRKTGRPYGGETQKQGRETRLKAAMVWSTVLGEPVCRKRAAGRKGGEAQGWKRTGR